MVVSFCSFNVYAAEPSGEITVVESTTEESIIEETIIDEPIIEENATTEEIEPSGELSDEDSTTEETITDEPIIEENITVEETSTEELYQAELTNEYLKYITGILVFFAVCFLFWACYKFLAMFF